MNRNRTVAGLDVHKDSVYLCIMGYNESVIFQKTYGVLTTELRQMRDDMLCHGVTECAMESTAVYWVPVWNELCGSMELKLVNPYFIKQLPGRKSDVKDAQWIAECVLKNLIKGSFVPEPVVQDMRKLNRRIMDLNEDMTYNCNKLDAALQRCGFRLSNYVSSTMSKSYQSVLQAIIGGAYMPRGACQACPWAHAQQTRTGHRKRCRDSVILQDRPDRVQTVKRDDRPRWASDRRMPERTDGTLQGTLSQTVRTSSDHPWSKGTRSHGNHFGNRD